MRKKWLSNFKIKKYFLLLARVGSFVKRSNWFLIKFLINNSFYVSARYLKKQLLNIFAFLISIKRTKVFFLICSNNLLGKRSTVSKCNLIYSNHLHLTHFKAINGEVIHIYYKLPNNVRLLNEGKLKKHILIGFIRATDPCHLLDYSFFLNKSSFLYIYFFNFLFKLYLQRI